MAGLPGMLCFDVVDGCVCLRLQPVRNACGVLGSSYGTWVGQIVRP